MLALEREGYSFFEELVIAEIFFRRFGALGLRLGIG